MNLVEAQEQLGNPNNINNIREIILRYFSNEKITPKITSAKNILITEILSRNTKINIRELVLPINPVCYACNGIGMLYTFHQKTTINPCPDCEGTGIFQVKCNKCENGLIKYKKGDHTITAKCPSCKGTGIHSSRACLRCLETGKIKLYERVEIKSSRLCPLCKGTGKYNNTKDLSNPLLTPGQALKIG